MIFDVTINKEDFDPVKGVFSYQTNINMENGTIGLVLPEEKNDDRVILNPLYTGGELVLKVKTLTVPAKRYKIGEKIATLVLV